MKRICYTVSILLFVSWISIFFIFRVGIFAHTLIMLAILFWLQGIILTTPKKVRDKAD